MSDPLQYARAALRHYETIEGVTIAPLLDRQELIRPLGDGLINETFLVELPHVDGVARAVLQRVNPLFGIAVHQDIEAITRHLQRRQLLTPVLVPTRDAQLALDLGTDGVWRMMTYIEGHTFAQMTPALAAPAGALTARFHAAVADLDHRFHFVRTGAHDFARHLQNLRNAVSKAEQHGPDQTPPGFLALSDSIYQIAANVPSEVPGPSRICHGDLKINNLRFDDAGQGLCLLDLDTLANLKLGLELGDALRSWCNPLGEDRTDSYFDLGLLQPILHGYATSSRGFVTVEEREFLITGALRITIQLAARFAADIINQSYFRYDSARFPSRAAHNQVRAQGQLSLARSLLAQQREAESLVDAAFTSA